MTHHIQRNPYKATDGFLSTNLADQGKSEIYTQSVERLKKQNKKKPLPTTRIPIELFCKNEEEINFFFQKNRKLREFIPSELLPKKCLTKFFKLK